MAKEAKSKKAPKTKSRAKAKPAKSAKPRPASLLKEAAANPLVKEVVAAALVATAAALKDSKKAQAMANAAGDQLEDLVREGAGKGKALWTLALEVAERAGGILNTGKSGKGKKKSKKG